VLLLHIVLHGVLHAERVSCSSEGSERAGVEPQDHRRRVCNDDDGDSRRGLGRRCRGGPVLSVKVVGSDRVQVNAEVALR
jgi:hypothetical protein